MEILGGYLIAIVILWIFFGFIVGSMAKDRGRDSLGYLFLALFISPLLAMIILLIQGDSDEKRIEKIEEQETIRSSINSKNNKATKPLMSDTAKYENLEKLGNLLEKGIITKEEFDTEKKRLLSEATEDEDEADEDLENACASIHKEILEAKGHFQGDTKLNEMIAEVCVDEKQALSLLANYERLYGKDLVKSICEISNTYTTIQHYLYPLIEIGIIEEKYPHKRIVKVATA